MLLAEKVALVTGGSRGIGRGICLAMGRQGARVGVVYSSSAESAEEVAGQINAGPGEAIAIQADVKDAEAAQAAVDAVVQKWERIDILVNSAGVIRDMLLLRMTQEDWDEVIDTNLGGVFNFCRAASRPMSSQRSGRIINISSVVATYGGRGQVNYAASKGGINAMTRGLASELASRKVTVNAIAPGMIETDMSQQVRQMAGDTVLSMIPLKRYGQPDDIAHVAVFLASDLATYVTGQVITVDGGLSLGPRW